MEELASFLRASPLSSEADYPESLGVLTCDCSTPQPEGGWELAVCVKIREVVVVWACRWGGGSSQLLALLSLHVDWEERV